MDVVDRMCGGSKPKKTAQTDEAAPLTDSDLLLQRFYANVDARGDSTYLTQPVDGGKVINYTFSEVYDDASRMAAHLKSLDLPAQSKVAIISKNCAHFVTAELSIWMAGHVTVALFPTLSPTTVKYIFEHSEARLLFVGKVEDNWGEMQKGVPDGVPRIGLPLAPKSDDCEAWESITGRTEPIQPERPTRAMDDESLLVYTSGSTGTPKGVLHSFRTISEPTMRLCRLHDITPADRYLSYLPIAHVMDRWLAECCSLYSGMHVFFAESLSTFVADLQRCRPTLFVSVPRLWLKFQLGVYSKMPKWKLDLLLQIPLVSRAVKGKILKNLGLDTVRYAGSGSAPIPAELLAWYRSLGLELLEGYGMSENFCYSHSTVPGKAKFGYIGNPFPGVDCKLSEEGEILVKSPGTMVGYYKSPDLTAEVMTEDGYLRTGDRGSIDSEGRLAITGRVKELFKTSKGKYVAPAPIENIINNDHNVEMSLVGGSGQVATMAVVQLAEDLLPKVSDPQVKARVTEELTALLAKANGAIEEYERIGFIVVAKDRWTVDAELLTPTMKIKRGAIEELYVGKLDSWYSSKEKVIWEE